MCNSISQAEVEVNERLVALVADEPDSLRPAIAPVSTRVVRRHAPRTLPALRLLGTRFKSWPVHKVARILTAHRRSVWAPGAEAPARRRVLKLVAATHPDADVRAIAAALLELDDEQSHTVAQLIALLSDSPAVRRQRVPRRDTGPPAPRHVGTPIVANAPPARLPIASENAERRAA
jgi:hypothetical protein